MIPLFEEQRPYAGAGLQSVLFCPEGGKAEEPLPVFTEPAPRSAHDVGVFEQVVEKLPAVHFIGAFEPDIGGIFSARVEDAEFVETVCDDLCVFAVVAEIFGDLLLPLLGKHCRRAHLGDVADAVELGGLPSRPEFVEGSPLPYERLGNDGIAATHPRKARRLGIGAEFDGALLCPLYLIDGTREGGVGDEVFIGGVIEKNGVLFAGILHPLFELFLCVCRARRIVGRAQIDDVRVHRKIGHGQKAVFKVCVGIENFPPRHDVGVHIDGVHGVRHEHGVFGREQVEDIAEV